MKLILDQGLPRSTAQYLAAGPDGGHPADCRAGRSRLYVPVGFEDFDGHFWEYFWMDPRHVQGSH